jgi:hypothetical protein
MNRVSNLKKEALRGGRVYLKGTLGGVPMSMQIDTRSENRLNYDSRQIDDFFAGASKAFDEGYRQEGMTPEQVGMCVRRRLDGLALNAQVDDIRRALKISRRVLQRPDERGQPTREVNENVIHGYAAYYLAKEYDSRQ